MSAIRANATTGRSWQESQRSQDGGALRSDARLPGRSCAASAKATVAPRGPGWCSVPACDASGFPGQCQTTHSGGSSRRCRVPALAGGAWAREQCTSRLPGAAPGTAGGAAVGSAAAVEMSPDLAEGPSDAQSSSGPVKSRSDTNKRFDKTRTRNYGLLRQQRH